MRSTKRLLAVGACVLTPFGVAACGDSDEDAAGQSGGAAAPESAGSKEAAEGRTPEEVFAPASEVAPGLRKLSSLAARIAAASAAEGKKQANRLEDLWEPIEGTVKKTEPDSYATIEEDLTLLASGDAARAKTGATELRRIVTSYVAAHPG